MTATLPGDLIYRVILDYEALHEMFRDRVEDLNTSRNSIDEAGGFTPGYAGKLLCNPPMRMLSRESLGKMLDATGMVLVAVVDDERFAAIKGTLAVRKRRDKNPEAKQASKAVLQEFKMSIIRANASLGGKRRLVKLSKRQRTLIAKAGAMARWSKKRTRNIAGSPAA